MLNRALRRFLRLLWRLIWRGALGFVVPVSYTHLTLPTIYSV